MRRQNICHQCIRKMRWIVDRMKTEYTNPHELPVPEFIYCESSWNCKHSTFRVRFKTCNGHKMRRSFHTCLLRFTLDLSLPKWVAATMANKSISTLRWSTRVHHDTVLYQTFSWLGWIAFTTAKELHLLYIYIYDNCSKGCQTFLYRHLKLS